MSLHILANDELRISQSEMSLFDVWIWRLVQRLTKELPNFIHGLRNVREETIILIGIGLEERDLILTHKKPLEEKQKIPLSREQGEKLAEKLGCCTYLEIEWSEESLNHLRELLFKIHFIGKELVSGK